MTAAWSTDTGRLSETFWRISPTPMGLGRPAAASSTAPASIVMLAGEPIGTPAAVRLSASVCDAVPPPPASESTPRATPSARCTAPYAAAGASTGSPYVTTIVESPVRLADSIRGAIPSATALDRTDASRLPDASTTGPPPLPAGLYDSRTPDGLSSARLPSRTSARWVELAGMTERACTETPAASPPATDQPAGLPDTSAPLIGSLNSTRISVRETAAAATTEGRWPSASVWLNELAPGDPPGWIVMRPVALGAASAGAQVITCELSSSSCAAVGVRASPSTSSPSKATWTGGVANRTVASPGPVMLADSTASILLSVRFTSSI